MKKNLLLFVSLFLFSHLLTAQDCDTEGRYLMPIFSDIDSTTVVYGQNTTINGVDTELDMELFYPANDVATLRPVILMAHGGFFIAGNREDMSNLCKSMATTGYVTASMSYRLLDLPLDDVFNLPDSIDMLDEVVKAVADMKAAVRYLKYTAANGNPYQIDSNAIFIGGGSAGAITALHTAFLDETDDIPQYIQDAIEDNGGFTGDTDHPTTSTMGHTNDIIGVVNLSGGIARTGWLQGNEDLSIISVHGDMDETVPYSTGVTKFVIVEGVWEIDLLYIEGSQKVDQKANALNMDSHLYTVVGGGHFEFYSEPDTLANLTTFALGNLYPLVCTQTGIAQIDDEVAINIQPTISNERFEMTWEEDIRVQQVQVVDMLGRTVWATQTTDYVQNLSINCSQWAKGIYNVIVQAGNKSYSQSVVVE